MECREKEVVKKLVVDHKPIIKLFAFQVTSSYQIERKISYYINAFSSAGSVFLWDIDKPSIQTSFVRKVFCFVDHNNNIRLGFHTVK